MTAVQWVSTIYKVCLKHTFKRYSRFIVLSVKMRLVKISSKVDDDTWNELKAVAAETHQNLLGLLTKDIREYLTRRHVRPVTQTHLEQSIDENEALGKLLAE